MNRTFSTLSRNLIVILCSITVGGTLLWGASVYEARYSRSARLQQSLDTGVSTITEIGFDEFESSMQASLNRWSYLYIPLAALAVVLLVGLFAKAWSWAWLVALLSLMPVIAMATAGALADPHRNLAYSAALSFSAVVLAEAIVWYREHRRQVKQ